MTKFLMTQLLADLSKDPSAVTGSVSHAARESLVCSFKYMQLFLDVTLSHEDQLTSNS